MAGIVLDRVSKVYADGTTAVSELSIDIHDEEFIVLVGPSGCGKTTALRMVAGLESITHGTIAIGDRVVNDVPPKERDIAMVFQNYALYPHMSVYDNMGFGLKLRKLPKEEIDRRVRQAADILGLEEFLERKPKALSGGQRQRVAMGRAIVREPQAFLMDEPLSNLDAKLRVQMRARGLASAARPRRHDDLRHARPDRGDDDGRPGGRDARRASSSRSHAARRCTTARATVRARVHRFAGDETWSRRISTARTGACSYGSGRRRSGSTTPWRPSARGSGPTRVDA
jgi:multiple sugar transport system ATP-binding protein